MCQSVPTRETDLTQDTQIYKNLQNSLTLAAHRARCGEVQKGYLCTGELKDPVEGLELTLVSHVSLYQQAEGYSLEG